MRARTKIILHRFARLRFDEAVVIRTDDGAFARREDLSNVLRPCRLGNEGIVSHNGKGVNGVVCTRGYLWINEKLIAWAPREVY